MSDLELEKYRIAIVLYPFFKLYCAGKVLEALLKAKVSYYYQPILDYTEFYCSFNFQHVCLLP